MKIKSRFICEACGIEFDKADDCLEHEKTCGKIESFTCNCCGETRCWDSNDAYEHTVNESMSHHIDLGAVGYGSVFDGCHIIFDVCDTCLDKWVQSFEIKPDFTKGWWEVAIENGVE